MGLSFPLVCTCMWSVAPAAARVWGCTESCVTLGDPPVMVWVNTPLRLGREVEGVMAEKGGDLLCVDM